MTTTEQIEAFRHALSLGQNSIEHVVKVVQHPTSGDQYAVVLPPERDAILWAAGPLGKDDDPQEVIDNQFSGAMCDDADWLSDALDQHNAWGRVTDA
jgi:hypothetical protein